MNCHNFHRLIEEGQMDFPDYEPSAELAQHLAICSKCAAEFRAQQETWLLMLAPLEKEPIPAELEERLMQGVARTSQSESRQAIGAPNWFGITKYALAAATLIALSVGSFWNTSWWNAERGVTQRGTVERDMEHVQEFARQLGKLDELERTFPSSDVRYVALHSASPQANRVGYLLYDLTAQQGHFFGQGLSPPPGHVAKVWLVDRDGRVMSSAVVPVNSQGVGASVVELPQQIEDIAEIWLTFESDAAAGHPSESIQLRDGPGK